MNPSSAREPAAIPLDPGKVGHRRRPAHTALWVFLAALFATVELLVVLSYRHAAATSQAVHQATDTTTTLANLVREALLLENQVLLMEGVEDVEAVLLRGALLERQLEVAEGQAGPGGMGPELDAFRDGLVELNDRLQVLDERSVATIVAARDGLVPVLDQLHLFAKQMFDAEEHRLYGAIGVDLEQGQRGQLILVGLGGFVLLFGAVLAVFLRRSVRADFARAHTSLLHEMRERVALQERLTHQAYHDPLTGLANRTLFLREVERALARGERAEGPTALIYVDLDDFKQVNDTLGHAAGDELLREVAGRLRACIRSTDTAARLGGDEFAVLLEQSKDAADVLNVVDRILAALREPFEARGHRMKVSASLGVVPAADPGVDVDDFIRSADLAMYDAKARGKGEYVVFADDLRRAVGHRLALERDLERAVAEREFVCHYQPIVELHTGRLRGMEALVRWRHPSGEVLAPAEFIRTAEETGLIHAIGDQVLVEATSTMAAWHERFDARDAFVSVNVSGRQFQDHAFAERVASTLRETGLPAQALVLEITESVMMQEPEYVARVLRELRELGVRIALDDFGIGYSSLSYLRFLPVDLLKIDRSFISDDDQDDAITATIARLASTLDIETVAEGIERPDQWDRLEAMGCELGQGFLIARPVDAERATEYLEATWSRRRSTWTDEPVQDRVAAATALG